MTQVTFEIGPGERFSKSYMEDSHSGPKFRPAERKKEGKKPKKGVMSGMVRKALPKIRRGDLNSKRKISEKSNVKTQHQRPESQGRQ